MSYSNLPIRQFLLHRPRFFAASMAVIVLLCAFVNGASAAGLAIEIIGGGANQIPITVVPFAGEDRFTQRMSQIISADLQRSGLFKLASIGSVRPLPSEPADINYRYWKSEGTETMVIGTVAEKTDGHAEVRFRMMDIAKQSQVLGFSYTVTVPQLRMTAQQFSGSFDRYGFKAAELLPLFTQARDWDPGARVLTDQYSPANLLNLER